VMNDRHPICGTSADRRPRILLVNDDPLLLDMLASAFSANGYDVTRPVNAEGALEHSKRRGPFQVLVTDVVMPGRTGLVWRRYLQAKMQLCWSW
jgi:DNA-binding response OmpR family regulator